MELREGKIALLAIRAAAIGSPLLGVGLGCVAIASWLQPSLALHVHVPAQLMALDSIAPARGSLGEVTTNLVSASTSLMGIFGYAARVLGVVGIPVAFYKMYKAARGDVGEDGFTGMILTLFVPGALITFSFIVFSIQDSANTNKGNDSRIVEYVESGSVDKALHYFLEPSLQSGALVDYTIAQAEVQLLDKSKGPQPHLEEDLRSRVKSVDDQAGAHVVDMDPQTLYALDMRAFGRPVSHMAVAYQNEQARMAAIPEALHPAVEFGAGVLAAGGLLYGLSRHMRKRVERIRKMLGTS